MSHRFFVRAGIVKIVISMLMVMLLMRVYYFTVLRGAEIKEKAQKQNSLNVEVAQNRSQIYDRHLRAITGVEKNNYAVIVSSGDSTVDFSVCKDVSQYSGKSEYDIYGDLHKNGKTIVPVDQKLQTMDYSNVKVLSVPARYSYDSPASSVVGYVSDGKGMMGIEKAFDAQLTKDGDIRVTARSDALMNFIPGGGFQVVGQASGTRMLKTTLDLNASRICQEALDNAGVKGGAVLLDVENFDVLAMVSSPAFDQNNIAESLKSADGNLTNRCLEAYDLGSVFKIVVAAAALENNTVPEGYHYTCNGQCVVAGKQFECHNEYGHGLQNFEQGFMNSCNPLFIDIGVKTGYTNILEMAKKFGLGQKTLCPLDFDQKAGSLPDENNYYLADLANFSIGQGKLSATVLQGAVLSAVIADGGVLKTVNIADSVIDNVGQVVEDLRVSDSKRIISEETAHKIYQMMLDTNLKGTGTTGFLEGYGSGGKTGSAQTGWSVNGELMQHGWYSGFFPAENPRYALCVFVENGKSGSTAAAPIFKEIGEKFMQENN